MREFLATIIALIVVLGLIIGLTHCANQKQIDSYNNGICPICETPFHFVNATYRMYRGYQYIYACNNEHIVICSQEQHQKN